jgi:hypothetical protein
MIAAIPNYPCLTMSTRFMIGSLVWFKLYA